MWILHRMNSLCHDTGKVYIIVHHPRALTGSSGLPAIPFATSGIRIDDTSVCIGFSHKNRMRDPSG